MAATQAVTAPAVEPPIRLASAASGRTSAVLETSVSTTAPVWGSANTSLARPSSTGTTGGKCSSGSPPRSKPSPATSDMPDRR